MIYAYDDWVQLPTMDLYDTLTMAMAINAAKDMYDKGEKRIDDFYEKYGDFMSPFAKDMETYGKMVGNINDTLDWMYKNGIDPLRSAEGRSMVALLTRSVDPAVFNMMKSNAKTGYAYLDAMQALRKQGKYSEAQELFDIASNGGTNFNDFGTLDGGKLNVWDRTSPIEAATLQELTKSGYEGRTARLLSEADFNDPRLAGKYTFDPKYEWSGYLYSDLLKGAPGAALSASADPRMAYFRDLAEKKIAAYGRPYTKADVDAQLYRDIADANTWALIDPTRKADEFALDDYKTANDIKAYKEKAGIDYYYKHKDDTSPTNTESGYSLLKDMYVTTLAKGAGLEYLPQEGVDVNTLPQLLKEAKNRQRSAVRSGVNILTATGQFISPDKINGVIPSSGANGNGRFLDPNFIHTLRTEGYIESSFGRDSGFGFSSQWDDKNSVALNKKELKKSEDITSGLEKVNGEKGYYVKVVPIPDKNHNNMYNMVGNDNRWHTYSRVKVYLSNGKDTRLADLGNGVTMPKSGIELVLPVGLLSNESKASPDLSVSAREKVGIGPYKVVKNWVGEDQDADFPWGTNLINDKISLQK